MVHVGLESTMSLCSNAARLALALSLVACSNKAPVETPAADPFVGRTKVTVFYSANLWGELLDCG